MEFLKKDITTIERGFIAHGVNCQGAMGSGVAKAIRDKWPKVYELFLEAPRGKDMLGEAHMIQVGPELFVVNCYTQLFYGYGGGRYASPQAIALALWDVFFWANESGLPIYLPRIGCGLGGLSWEKDVKPLIEYHERTYPNVQVYICDLE